MGHPFSTRFRCHAREWSEGLSDLVEVSLQFLGLKMKAIFGTPFREAIKASASFFGK